MRLHFRQVPHRQRSHEVGGGSANGRKPDDLRGMEQGWQGSRCERSTGPSTAVSTVHLEQLQFAHPKHSLAIRL